MASPAAPRPERGGPAPGRADEPPPRGIAPAPAAVGPDCRRARRPGARCARALRAMTAPGRAGPAGSRQADLVERAASLFPGGVNSPVRAFRSVGRPPLLLDAGAGPRVRDANGRWYVDYIGAWGPAILGHAHPAVVAAVREALEGGFALGATSPREVDLGEAIRAAMPSMEKMRFTSSGTEAAMSALRVARGATGRDLIVKLAGGYHGHSEGLLVDAGSGVATLGIPGSAGVPAQVAATTIVVPINDLNAMRAALERHPRQVAAIIVEPVAANVGVVAPANGYLEGLRSLADAHGTILIFDEVITGFRVAHGGAQARYGVRPDLTVLGKIIGGGMPVGAYGGRRDLMAHVAPDGPVYQAGTLSGHRGVRGPEGLDRARRLPADGLLPRVDPDHDRRGDGRRSIRLRGVLRGH